MFTEFEELAEIAELFAADPQPFESRAQHRLRQIAEASREAEINRIFRGHGLPRKWRNSRD